MNEALRDWVTNVAHHPLRDRLGRRPAPVPDAGARAAGGDRPRGAHADPGGGGPPARRAVACVGGGSNAIGLFHAFVADTARRASSASRRRATASTPHRHAATLGARAASACCTARARTCCATTRARSREAHSISRGPRLSRRRPRARVLEGDAAARSYLSVTDDEALAGFQRLARTEGILCALESAHAIAALPKVDGVAARRRHHHRQRLRSRRQGHGDDRLASRRDRCEPARRLLRAREGGASARRWSST